MGYKKLLRITINQGNILDAMFKAATSKIQEFARQQPNVIRQLESLFAGNVSMYIDYANVRSWVSRLQWHIDLERLHQFLRSFGNITAVSFYNGTLSGDQQSEENIEKAEQLGYRVRTKPVKIMRISVNASSISPQSPDLLKQFIHASLIARA